MQGVAVVGYGGGAEYRVDDAKVSSIPADADRSLEGFEEVVVLDPGGLLSGINSGRSPMVVQRALTRLSRTPISDAVSPTIRGSTTGVQIYSVAISGPGLDFRSQWPSGRGTHCKIFCTAGVRPCRR